MANQSEWPAPAQDERENWNVALLQVAVVLEALRSADSAARLANMNAGKVLGEAYAKLKDIRATRPAQTEQRPVATWMGTDWNAQQQLIAQLCKLEPGTDLYAAPIAQTTPSDPADASQVKGTPGSRTRSGGNEVTEHRTGEDVGEAAPLTLHEQKQPPLVSAGELFPPALPSPRRQERDDKGRALGVDLELPSRVQPWPSETALLLR